MAAHLVPITNGQRDRYEEKTFFRGAKLRKRRIWAADNRPPTVVWGHGTLIANMIAVLDRRMLSAAIRGLADKPLASATFARLEDLSFFLGEHFDDRKCADLLAGLIWAQPTLLRTAEPARKRERAVLPFAYAAIKPVFSTNEDLVRSGAISPDVKLPIPTGLLSALRLGGQRRDGERIDPAVRQAFARARSSGLNSPYDPIRQVGSAAADGSRIGVGVRSDRLAAAMLIPISRRGLASLLRRAYPGSIPQNTSHPSKETPNAD